MYDIVIVGAGPAGANLARLISGTYKVLLLDKRDLAEEDPKNLITKCCGGLLAPDAQKMIAQLGLGMPKEILIEGLDGYMERYKKKVKEIKFNLLLKTLKSPAMYQPSLRRLAMESGLQSIR